MPSVPTAEKVIFLAAAGLTSRTSRAAFLDNACAGEPDLRRRVEELLAAHDSLGGLSTGQAGDDTPTSTLAQSLVNADATVSPGWSSMGPGTRIGPCKLLQVIDEGGMGVVYLAEQTEGIAQRVALKLIKPGTDSSQVVARFEAERQALAMMDHPNIARVLTAGSTGTGQPYFVMELVNGIPITRYCDEYKLTPARRLELFVLVCQAIQHAHQKGIIHRDIKPSNVLVAISDGAPLPKVIDFGIAKATEQRPAERTMFTQVGMAIGTFQYMPPEQAEITLLGMDTRADVYSLGVLLYELLTGTTPLEPARFQGMDYSGVVRLIREEEPPAPSRRLSGSAQLPALASARGVEPGRLVRLVRGEMDWIVLKCLEKDRTRRYGTAEALAEDVLNYLHDRPVLAHPPSALYRVRKFARKHFEALLAVALLAATLVAGAVVSRWQAVQAIQARQELRRGLTRQVAERIEGDLGRFAAVGDALGATAARREDWTEAQLCEWMTEILRREPKVFGLCLAYEPRASPWKSGDHLYKCRTETRGQQVRTKVLEYKNGVHEEDWYKLAKDGRRPAWSEPFLDIGCGDIPMVTYVAPLIRGGKFIGVLTVDLSLAYFDQLRRWLADLNLSPQSYGFVLSPTGNVISHPDPEYDFGRRLEAGHRNPRNVTDPGSVDPAFASLARRMRKEGTGEARAVDPITTRPATFLFARVPLDRNDPNREWWTFVMVLEE